VKKITPQISNSQTIEKLKWKTPPLCDGALIQRASPYEDIVYIVVRPQGEKAGDKWRAAVFHGVKGMSCKSAKSLTDDVSKETAIAVCELHWFGPFKKNKS